MDRPNVLAPSSNAEADLNAYSAHRDRVLTIAQQLADAMRDADHSLPPRSGVRHIFARSRFCLDEMHVALAGDRLR